MSEESREEGSEIVSHALVQVLVVFVFLLLMQSALFLHARNTAISAASEGARRYSLLEGRISDADEQVRDVMAPLVGSGAIEDLVIHEEKIGSGNDRIAVVTFRTTLPLFINWGPSWLRVRGSSVMEKALP